MQTKKEILVVLLNVLRKIVISEHKKETFAALQVLKQGRAEMVQDFLDHKPEIYAPSFKYEDSPALLSLAREKYFMMWLSSHWQLFSHEATFYNDKQKETEVIFSTVFLKLLGKWSIVETNDSRQLNLGISLVKDMETALNQFIKAGEKSELMRNTLEMALEKNRVIFDRAIKKLSEQEI
jgi:hypothetical protein